MFDPLIKYIIDGKNVIPVLKANDYWLIQAGNSYRVDKYELYDDKMDAMYYNLLHQLSEGISLDNYKGSKYYKYYMERLKVENPEYLI